MRHRARLGLNASGAGQAPPDTIASLGLLGGNLETNSDFFGPRLYTSVLRGSRAPTGSALDASGWPTGAFSWVLSTKNGNAAPGLYKGIATSRGGGAVTVTAAAGCTITNVVAVGDTCTFDLTINSTGNVTVNVSGGVLAFEVKRPGFALADTTRINPDAIIYHGPFGSLRMIKMFGTETNNTMLNWAGSASRTSTVTLSDMVAGTWAWTAHGLSVGDRVTLSISGGALPIPFGNLVSGGVQLVPYFVQAVPDADHFRLALDAGGPAIVALDVGSGTFTATANARPTPSNTKFGGTLSWEESIELANSLRASAGLKSLWVNFPYAAGDAFVTAAAVALRDTAHPSIDIYPEQGNEDWNPSYLCYYYWIQKGLDAVKGFLRNGTIWQHITAISRTANVVTVQMAASSPLASQGWPSSGPVTINAVVPLGGLGVSADGVVATVTGPTSFTYASVGADGALSTPNLENAMFIANPTHEINYDGANNLTLWAFRMHCKRVRANALIFETVFGAGSLNTRVKVPLCWQQYQKHDSLVATLQNERFLRGTEYLETQYPSRPLRSYLYMLACAPYATLSLSVADNVDAVVASWNTAVDTNLVDFLYLKAHASLYGLEAGSYEHGLSSQGSTYTNLSLATLQAAYADPRCRTAQYNHHHGAYLRGAKLIQHFNLAPGQFPTSGTNLEYFYMQETIADADSQRRLACKDVLAEAYPTAGFLGRENITGLAQGATSFITFKNFLRLPSHAFNGASVSWMANSNGIGCTNNASFGTGQWIDKDLGYCDTAGAYTINVPTSLGGGVARTCTVQINRGRADEQASQNYVIAGNSGSSTGVTAYNGELAITLPQGWNVVRFKLPDGVAMSVNVGVARTTKL